MNLHSYSYQTKPSSYKDTLY